MGPRRDAIGPPTSTSSSAARRVRSPWSAGAVSRSCASPTAACPTAPRWCAPRAGSATPSDVRARRPSSIGRRRVTDRRAGACGGRGRDARAHARAPAARAGRATSRCIEGPPESAASRRRGDRPARRRDRSPGTGTTTSRCSRTAARRSSSRELGLDDEMQWVETKTGYYGDGQLSSVSNTRRVPPAARPDPDRQAPPRRHDPVRVAGHATGGGSSRMTSRRGCARWSGRRDVRAASGCRCCGPSSARATGRRRPRSSGRRSSGCTRRGAAG